MRNNGPVTGRERHFSEYERIISRTDLKGRITICHSEIASASREQSAGIEQVNKAVMQMDEMTQKNASLVDEAVGESRAVEREASTLAEMTAFFRLDATATISGPARPAPQQDPPLLKTGTDA